ncbi:NUDIX domain-containing protein [Streptomyces piniterrae]|uniref:NUDIX domain-containing protein n=1 Tax=Streptomyces piniterrae TaxID=2571125 RepID=A0A4U0NQI7_9ACTN|nr:DUF6624 domain-containing protein [Streptomyces piniterrae]TJZ56819.1 NUDIX domain-containing protein [Streptomyces piniterrae]
MDARHHHPTVSVYLFARFGATWRMGVIGHPRLGGAMIPGGHIEPDASPAQAAVRETLEETGYRVRLLPPVGHDLPTDYPHPEARPTATTSSGSAPWWVVDVPAAEDSRLANRQEHVDLHVDHLHVDHPRLDHIHVAVVDRPYGPRTPGAHLFRWISVQDLPKLDTPEGTRIPAPTLVELVSATIAAHRPRSPLDDGLRRELLRRRDIDQEFRTNLPETLTEEEFARWEAMDNDNTEWLRKVIDRVGWPGRSLCGDEAADAAWLLAQHADRQPHLQEAWVDLLAEAVTSGEAEPRHLAFLEDRISVRKAREQWFGTQHHKGANGQWEPYPIREPLGVDKRRAEVGLNPLAERTRQIAEENRH